MALNKVILCALFFSCVTLAPGQPIQELAFRALAGPFTLTVRQLLCMS